MNQIWTFGIKPVINHCAIIPSPWNFLDTCIIWAKSKYFIQWGSHRMVKCRSRISKNGFLPCVCLVEALHPLDTHRLQSLTFQPKFNGNSFRSFLLRKISLWNIWHLLSFRLFELCARHFLSFTSLMKNTMQQSLKTNNTICKSRNFVNFFLSIEHKILNLRWKIVGL